VKSTPDGSDTQATAATVPSGPSPSTTTEGAEDATQTAGPAPPWESPLSVGTRLGRYVLLEVLGRGGTAVVYKAYDPDLHREVAVKVLRLDRDDRDRAHARLLREAQALARLSHPNVIAVYDVGVYGEDVFVAMELVAGQTLRQWLRVPRTMREVLDVMTAAGRGLAAAHAVGLIHRDFKPGNVMLGADDRVRVLDFGLARRGGGGDTPMPRRVVETTTEKAPVAIARGDSDHHSTETDSLLDADLTRADVLVGTPAYMAPEQFTDGAVDERSDQFAFAATLYEALYGVRPYVHPRRAPDLRSWQHQPPPPGARVPGWLRAVVMRGIELDPDRRYPTMQHLLDDLGHDPSVRRRRLLAAATAAVALSAGAVAIARARPASEVCRPSGAELAGAWDGGRRDAARGAFLASGHPLAADRFARFAGAVDDYASRWQAMRTDACRATRVVGAQSEALLDRRMACLERLRGRLGALTQIYTHNVDRELVDGAPDAAYRLGDLDRCADVDALLAAAPPPADPVLRARADDLRRRLDEAAAQQQAGRSPAALEAAKPLVAEAAQSGDVHLQAQAHFLIGDLDSDMGETAASANEMYEAARLAAEAHDDELVAQSVLTLAWVIGYQEARVDDGMAMLRVAEAAVARAGGDDYLRLILRHRRIGLLHRKGDFAIARAEGDEALRLAEAVYGPDHPRVADVLVALGAGLYETKELPAARASLERALAIYQRALGAEHPRINYALENLGLVLEEQHDYAGAAKLYQRTVDLLEATYGPDHVDVGHALTNLGSSLIALHRYDEAERALLRSLKINEAEFGAEHPDVADPLFQLGQVSAARGDRERAIAYHQRALAIRQKVLDKDHPRLAQSREALERLGVKPQ